MGKKWVMAFCLSVFFVSFAFSNETKTIFELYESDTVSMEDIYELFYLRSMVYLRSAEYYFVEYWVLPSRPPWLHSEHLTINETYTDSGGYICTSINYSFNNGTVYISISDHGFSSSGKDAKRIITFREGTVGRREICEDINWVLTAAEKESDLVAKTYGYVSSMVITTLFE
jgi:hypothetical protein